MYHPSFAKVERICEELVAGAAEFLKTSDSQDKYTQWLMRKIYRHQAIAYPAPKKISLVGDSGVVKYTVLSPTYARTDYQKGKSFLINSILHTRNLAAYVCSSVDTL